MQIIRKQGFPYRSVSPISGDTYQSVRLSVRTGLSGYRYADRPLPGGTAKINRRRLIEGEIDRQRLIEGEKGKKKKRKRRKKRRRKNTSCHPRPWVAR
ncbi:hypothetical protein BHE74_00041754 [Ensete ventricosum]|nr:hypothetical protein BHE74_00041754 [Ensete ventricosum]